MTATYQKLQEITTRGRAALPDWLQKSALRAHLGRLAAMLADAMPKGLYARALIIIIAPIVLLESVVAFTFMERHWNQVTRRLSEATARNVAAIVDLYESQLYENSRLEELAQNRFGLTLTVMTGPGELPKAGQGRPFFDLLDRALPEEIAAQVKRR